MSEGADGWGTGSVSVESFIAGSFILQGEVPHRQGNAGQGTGGSQAIYSCRGRDSSRRVEDCIQPILLGQGNLDTEIQCWDSGFQETFCFMAIPESWKTEVPGEKKPREYFVRRPSPQPWKLWVAKPLRWQRSVGEKSQAFWIFLGRIPSFYSAFCVFFHWVFPV